MGLIRFEGITKSFSGRLPIIENTSFSINEGEFIFLTGISGSGKSTVLKLLYRLLNPDSGKIYYREVSHSSRKSLAAMRKNFGYMPQIPILLEKRTVRENILLPLQVRNDTNLKPREAIDYINEVCGLNELMSIKTVFLSGGEKQIVSLARAIINHPPVIIADEPTAHLDRKMALKLVNILMRLNEQGTTVIISTHDIELLRAFEARIMIIKDRAVQDFSGKQI